MNGGHDFGTLSVVGRILLKRILQSVRIGLVQDTVQSQTVVSVKMNLRFLEKPVSYWSNERLLASHNGLVNKFVIGEFKRTHYYVNGPTSN